MSTSLVPTSAHGVGVGTPSSSQRGSLATRERNGPHGSISVPPSGARRATDLDFNLGAVKARVMKQLDDRTPQPFKKFFGGPLYDSLLNACLLYFTSRFMHDWVVKAMDKARKMHLEGYNPYAVAQRLQELEEEMDAQRLELSPIYSQIILKYSSYDKPQQDRMFFECLYETLVSILFEAFCSPRMTGAQPAGPTQPGGLAAASGAGGAAGSGASSASAAAVSAAAAAAAAGADGGGSSAAELAAQRRAEIEGEIGGLFRSRHFNSNQRKYEAPRSVDTLGVKELYSLKHETGNRALNAKMLSSLYAKPTSLAVQVASVTNSPLISQYISSPIVARAKVKDPLERKSMFESLGKAEKPSARTKLSRAFRSIATARGVDVSGLKGMLSSMRTDEAGSEAVGLLPADRSYRDRRTAPRGVVAPESIGLAADDTFNYLALLKRYVLYGPMLGMVPGAAGAGQSAGGAALGVGAGIGGSPGSAGGVGVSGLVAGSATGGGVAALAKAVSMFPRVAGAATE